MKKQTMIMGLLVALGVHATDPAVADEQTMESMFDTIWSYGQFINNKDAKGIQKLELTGRLQGDAAYYSSEDHGDFDDLLWRRFRIGGKATLFQDFLIHLEADIDLNKAGSDDFYKRLTDAYIGWSPSKAFKLKVGKQSAGFTLDGATSSKKLLTLERSIVAGNLWFTTEYFTGISGSVTSDGWSYRMGGFSSGGEDEFGDFDSGWFGLVSVGRDLSENVNLRVDYVHNEPDYSGDVGTKKLTDVFSVVSKSKVGKLGLWTDLSYAKGDDDADQSDLIGLQLMPFYDFNETWQGVCRYSLVHSTEGSGAGMGHYLRKNLSDSQYEDIHDFYLGLNAFLYGHKLKWQTGLEYTIARDDSTGSDYNGWGITTGFRISW